MIETTLESTEPWRNSDTNKLPPSVLSALFTLMASRRLRAFKRWMNFQGFEYSDGLDFKDDPVHGISVVALSDLKEGDVVATIPKSACLTVKTSGAREIIESAELGGSLGLAVSVMYERSLGEDSPWAGYLQLLPEEECLPLVWSLDDLDSLLSGTEIHKTVKEDKALIYEDWKESILPLLDSASLKLKANYFSVEQYFAAKSLIASRSFEIDEYHGSGMVPLADLFNHKTGSEDVHFTSVDSDSESDHESDDNENADDASDGEISTKNSVLDREESAASRIQKNISDDSDLESSPVSGDEYTVLQMIMVKNVSVGTEVFNTYGMVGNAALLHRYGFTEPDNPYDIINIDLELVLQWSSSLFSSRYSRARLSLWRRLGYSGCLSEDSEYFEITYDGEPQTELLVLLYIISLSEDTYCKLDLTKSIAGSDQEPMPVIVPGKNNGIQFKEASEMNKELFLTESVCNALTSLAGMRESFYGPSSKEDDIEALRSCSVGNRKMYHSLVLRTSEKWIIEKLRAYAAKHVGSCQTASTSTTRKGLKRKKV